MRILGIVASAFSGLIQKIYSWSHNFVWANYNFFSYHSTASSSLKYLAINATGDTTRRSTLLSSTADSGSLNAVFSTSNPAGSVVHNNSIVMVGCGNDTNARSRDFKHTNTINNGWTTVTDSFITPCDRKGGIWDPINNRFIFCSNTSTNTRLTVLTETSSNIWTPNTFIVVRTTGIGISDRMSDIGFNNSSSNPFYVLVKISSGTTVFTTSSNSLDNWSETTVSTTSRGWRSVAYGNGMWVLIGNPTVFATSTDGINWTERAWNQGSSRPDSFTQVRFVNDRFVTSLRNSVGAVIIATSFDGITWEFFSVGDLNTYATLFWSYSSHEDIIFSSMFDDTDTYNVSPYITRGIVQ